MHATDDDLLMPLANKLIAAPGDWTSLLGEVAVAIAQSKNIAAPAELASLQPSATAKQIAAGLTPIDPNIDAYSSADLRLTRAQIVARLGTDLPTLRVLLEQDARVFAADRKSTCLNSSHIPLSRMPSSA